MITYFHFISQNNVILSNVPRTLYSEIDKCKAENMFCTCPILKKTKRHGKKNTDSGFVYLCIYTSNITTQQYKRILDILILVYNQLCRIGDCETEEARSKVLRHNINNYNAKIQDELESIIPQESIAKKDWKETINIIKEDIQDNPETTAFTLFRILKNIKLINAEMNVFDLINSNIEELDLQKHSIHKVVGITLQPFFLDFIQNSNHINIGNCYEDVLIDYSTFSVVLGHIWDNASKYMGIESELNILFRSDSTSVIIEISMQSLYIEESEAEAVFMKNYSGTWANKASLNGYGIGMYYAKKLTEMNGGSIVLQRGDLSYMIGGLPYANNKIIIRLQKYIP